jgi:hypothetical protein
MTDGPLELEPAPPVRGERRWPMATATLATGVLHQLLPSHFRVGPQWIYPAALVVFLALLISGDPGIIDRQRPSLRVLTNLMIVLIALVNAFSAGRLVVGILGKTSFGTAAQLLLTGAIIWLINVIAFGLWYWDLDGGGAASRLANGPTANRALIFPEMTLPEYVGEDWAPQFMDYLALSFNTATAFGPTDVSAIKKWTKLMMVTESLISLALATLVVARAVNIL